MGKHLTKLFANAGAARIPCPLCRTTNYRSDFIKLVYPHPEVLVKKERSSIKKTLRNIRTRKLQKIIRELNTLLVLEQERSHIMSLPSIAFDKRIMKQRNEYISYLNSKSIENQLSEFVVGLKRVDHALSRIIKNIESPSDSVSYDIGRHLARKMCEFLNGKKRKCPSCAPKV